MCFVYSVYYQPYLKVNLLKQIEYIKRKLSFALWDIIFPSNLNLAESCYLCELFSFKLFTGISICGCGIYFLLLFLLFFFLYIFCWKMEIMFHLVLQSIIYR